RAIPGIIVPAASHQVVPACQLYQIRLELGQFAGARAEIFRALRAETIVVNVHFIPVHLHPYYRDRFGYKGGEFPIAEAAYESLISLPMFHGMSDEDVKDVVRAMEKVVPHYAS